MMLTHSVKVCPATRPCDLRKSFDTLSVVFREELRQGIDLSPNTMGDAAAKVADQFGLLVVLMQQRMIEGGYVRADETFIRYLESKCSSASRAIAMRSLR
jgi:hypothetical protein